MASTKNGGSLTALAREGCIDLWWVGEKGQLLKSSFTTKPEEWSESSYLVYCDMGPGIEDPSILSATLSNGSAAIDVPWITPSGRVQGESTHNDRLHGFVYGFYDEGVDGVTACTISSLAVQGDETATRLW